jgi:hypothetical protein
MSTDYYPLAPIRMADLFGRVKNLGVHEELCEGTSPDKKCLTDGQNFVWISCSGRELVSSFTSYGRNDPEHILQVISEEFGVRIVREDEYWNEYERTEERRAAWDAMAEKADQEFSQEMVKFVRGEDHDIKPGSIWMTKAEIAKRLTANSPDLLADAKRPDLLKAIEMLRVTLSSALSFERLEVLIEHLKTLLKPQAGGHGTAQDG